MYYIMSILATLTYDTRIQPTKLFIDFMINAEITAFAGKLFITTLSHLLKND